MKRYTGPPGDDRVYWLPRDRDDLDAAWDAYYAAQPQRDPSKWKVTTTAEGIDVYERIAPDEPVPF